MLSEGWLKFPFDLDTISLGGKWLYHGVPKKPCPLPNVFFIIFFSYLNSKFKQELILYKLLYIITYEENHLVEEHENKEHGNSKKDSEMGRRLPDRKKPVIAMLKGRKMAIVPSGTMAIVDMKIFATNYMKFQHVTMDRTVLDRIVNIFMIKILETIF